MEKVARRREKIHRYILQRIAGGSPPTVREICKDLHILSTSTVHSDLKFLTEIGAIEMSDGLGRSIRLPGQFMRPIPLLGSVSAGVPILATENIEQYIPVAIPYTHGQDLFALRVKGDSMINAAILDGDIVIVEKTTYAQNGQIVVACIDEQTTVKRYFKENNLHRLQPENNNYPPMIFNEIDILGRVLSVIRYYC